jgi:hypothetical protein
MQKVSSPTTDARAVAKAVCLLILAVDLSIDSRSTNSSHMFTSELQATSTPVCSCSVDQLPEQ